MPPGVSSRSRHAAAARSLSWTDLARFTILLLRVRWLNRRLGAAHRDVGRRGLDVAGPSLLSIARRWIAAHEAIGALLKTTEPPEVGQVRAMMQPSKSREGRDA